MRKYAIEIIGTVLSLIATTPCTYSMSIYKPEDFLYHVGTLGFFVCMFLMLVCFISAMSKSEV